MVTELGIVDERQSQVCGCKCDCQKPKVLSPMALLQDNIEYHRTVGYTQLDGRNVHTLHEFNLDYGLRNKQKSYMCSRVVKKLKQKSVCNKKLFVNFLVSLFPILQWLPKYSIRKDATLDLMGGLTVGVMSIPQGMAYAKLAGMEPVYGLYMNVVPSLVYVVFGTGRHASMGAVTLMSLMMGAIRYQLIPCESCWKTNETQGTNFSLNVSAMSSNGYDNLTPIDIGMSTAFLVGLFMILMGLIRLDVLTTYLSDQVVSGFTVGAAVHIFTAQLDTMFGLKITKSSGPGKIIKDYINFFSTIHKTNIATIIIGWSSVVFLLILKLVVNPRVQPKIRIPLPGELFVVIIGIIVSYYVNVKSTYNVKIVDFIPSTFPMPSLPRFDIMSQIALDSFLIAIVTYCQSISQVKLYAKMHKYKVDGRQEFFAYGAMNFLGSFFQCFNCGLSVSRTIVFEKTGAKSQLASLVGVVVVVLTILFISPYLALLPQGILASIIIVACVDLFRQLKELKNIWAVSKVDFAIYVVTFVSIVLLDVTYGLLCSVLFAFFSVVLRTQCRTITFHGLVSGKEVFVDIDKYSEVKEMPGVKIVHFSAPLYYANVDVFKDKLYKKCLIIQSEDDETSLNAKNEEPASLEPTKHLIIDCSGFMYIDLMGVNTLKQIHNDLTQAGISVWYAQANAIVQKTLHKSTFFDVVPKDNVFVTLMDALSTAAAFDRNNNNNNNDDDKDKDADGKQMDEMKMNL